MKMSFAPRNAAAFGILLLSSSAMAGAQDVGKDVPSTHWAYAAVQDLAAKGLIKGYPADGNFLGGRALTRYEMATIIERVLAHVDDLVSKAGKGDGVSKAELEKLATSLQEIRDLTDEFKKELLVIGSDPEPVQKPTLHPLRLW